MLFLLFLLLSLPLFLAQQNPTDTNLTCTPGNFNTGNECTPCPPGTISTTPNTFLCTLCPFPLTPSPARTSCLPCRKGHFLNSSNNNLCTPCPISTYSSADNSTSCTKCPPTLGTFFTGKTGLSDCFRCGPGERISFDLISPLFSECISCGQGSLSDPTDAYSCVKCPPGFTSPIDAEACAPCPAGTFALPTRRCKPCKQGMYQSKERAAECKKCPPGSVSGLKRRNCVAACRRGELGCRVCNKGFGFNVETAKCKQCPPGTVNDAVISTECWKCPYGLVPNSKRDRCVCTGGKALGRRGGCEECPKGSSSSDGFRCKCEGGRVLKYGECKCKPNSKPVGNKCMPCSQADRKFAKRFPFNRRICQLCEPNQFFEKKSGRCRRCPGGTKGKIGLSQSCKPCTNVFTTGSGRLACGCGPGLGLENGLCVACKPGTYSRAFDRNCRRCFFGEFSDKPMAARCKRCRSTRNTPTSFRQGLITCPTPCVGENVQSEGQFCGCKNQFRNIGTREEPNCERCNEPKVAVVNRRKCECPAGSIIRGEGCRKCAAGSFPSKDRTHCELCPPGTYAVSKGSEFCEPCRSGAVAVIEGATRCVTCGENEFPGLGGGCNSCAVGQRVRNRECVDCVNSVSNGGAAGFCTECKGRTMPNKEKSACV